MTAPDDPFAPPPAGSIPAYPTTQPTAPAYGEALPSRRNGFGVAALVLGILSLLGTVTVVLGILLGVLAVVFGVLGRGRAKRGEADNGGAALAGIIMGTIAVLLSAAFVATVVAFFRGGTGKDLRSCLHQARNDQTAVTACQDKFRKDVTGG